MCAALCESYDATKRRVVVRLVGSRERLSLRATNVVRDAASDHDDDAAPAAAAAAASAAAAAASSLAVPPLEETLRSVGLEELWPRFAAGGTTDGAALGRLAREDARAAHALLSALGLSKLGQRQLLLATLREAAAGVGMTRGGSSERPSPAQDDEDDEDDVSMF